MFFMRTQLFHFSQVLVILTKRASILTGRPLGFVVLRNYVWKKLIPGECSFLTGGGVSPWGKKNTVYQDCFENFYALTSLCKVNGALWDLPRPLEGDCNLEILKFDSDEG